MPGFRSHSAILFSSMKMPHDDWRSLWTALGSTGDLPLRFISGANATVRLSELVHGSSIEEGPEQLRGRSVLVATGDQFAAALALIELDGIAQRVIICPDDFSAGQLRMIAEWVPIDGIVSDRGALVHSCVSAPVRGCGPRIKSGEYDRRATCATEWILFTSGTTGSPKLVKHNLSTLAGAIPQRDTPSEPLVWSTFYDIRRYGGLQIFLRAMLTGQSLVLRSLGDSIGDFLIRAGGCGITHLSGTPSHWRRALMCPAARNITPKYVRLSGEVVDQPILDNLRSFYPQATIVHAFASTEAGVAFEVHDGLAGVPASLLDRPADGVELKIEEGSLRIRSRRASPGYIGARTEQLAGSDGFVDTGDMLERRGDRYYFVGRRDGTIKVGGWKVHPEEVEAVINGHPRVAMSLVRARKNPLTGALVVAEVVQKTEGESNNGIQPKDQLEQEILQLCRKTLAQHKVPVAIRFVSHLQLAETGKLVRQPCEM